MDGPKPNQFWTLSKDSMILGRDDDCDIVLAERQVSRQHIRIYWEGNRYFITDLESKNGTWVNGQRLEGTRELNDGDEIHVALAIHAICRLRGNCTASVRTSSKPEWKTQVGSVSAGVCRRCGT
jgi:predicted component of type VI protein secretion system